ncbi:MAG TPA: translocation/assembly module TamB domain-containing protein [Polyangiaceae bacterium]|nr:translocation/assembly module TamB domain-containing protein [Polyangiaceae bacterium]
MLLRPVLRPGRRVDLGRWFARFACVVFGLLGALPLLVEGVLRLHSVQSYVDRQTAQLLSRELGLVASYEVTAHLIPLRLTVERLRVPASDGGSPALEVEKVIVTPRIFSLLAGRLDVGNVEIESPRARLVLRDGKLTNVKYTLKPSKGSPKPSKEAPFSALSVSEARVSLDLDGLQIESGPTDIDVFAESGPAFEVMLSGAATNLEWRHPPKRGTLPIEVDEDRLCRLDLRARIEGRQFLVRRLSALGVSDLDPAPGSTPSCDVGDGAVGRVALRLSQLRVSLPERGAPLVSGHVVVRGPLALTNRFVATQPLAGWAGFAGDVRYDGRTRLPLIQGHVSGAGIAFERYRLASSLSVDVDVRGDVVRVPRYEMDFADGHVVLENARIDPFAEGVPLSVSRVDSRALTFPGLMRDLGVTPNTIVAWNMIDTLVSNLKGTLSPLKFDADLAADTKDFEVTDRAFHDPHRKHMVGVKSAEIRGKIGVRPNALIFYDTRAEFGKSSMQVKLVSIGFDNRLELEIGKGSRLHLADVSPIVDIPVAGESELDASMSGAANDPVLLGNLSVKGFEFGGFPLGDIKSAKAKFRPLFLELSDVLSTKGSSDFTVPFARIDFGTRASVAVQAQARSPKLDLRDFFKMWHFDEDPRFEPIRGTSAVDASIRYVLGGPEDRCGGGVLRVQGQLKTRELELYEEHYDGGESSFDFLWHDREAAYRGVIFNAPDFTLNKGSGRIAGELTMQTGAKVAGKVVATGIPVGKIDALPTLLRAAEGTVNATGTVSGTLDALVADINANVSAIQLGLGSLPASTFRVHLQPTIQPETVIGKTRCGEPISGPFERAQYDRDLESGVFYTDGELFGGQIVLERLSVTRQRDKTVRGKVHFRDLGLGALLQLGRSTATPSTPMSGLASGTLSLDELRMADPKAARGTLALKTLAVERQGYRVQLLDGAQPFRIGGRAVDLPSAALQVETPEGQKAVFDLSGRVSNLGQNPQLDAGVQMRPTALASLVGLVPRVERANGVLSGRFRLTGALNAPSTTGTLDLQRGELALRGLPTPLSDIDVGVAFDHGELRVERGSARLGSGSVSFSGSAPLRGFSIGEGRFRAVAHEVSLPLKEGIHTNLDADLQISIRPAGDSETRPLPRVTGNVMLRSFEYKRPITIAADLNTLAQRGKRTAIEDYDSRDDAVEFDVNLRSGRPLKIQNDIVEAELVLSEDGLELAGTNGRFGLRGNVRLKQGGRVTLRRSEFEIQEGSVRFDDLTRIAPLVDVSAVTEYRRYSDAPGTTSQSTTNTATLTGTSTTVTGGRWTIRMHAYGDADNLKVDLSSTPALAQDDIFLLLTVGLTRAELDQAQSASVGGSVALEALGTLTGADRAVKKVVPIIDEFRFGSAYSSRTGRTEPTVTVGKRLTERVRANITSGLSESREVRSNVEWRLSPKVSVEGSYDNVNDISSSALGNLGADVRWRLEFE